MIVGNDIVDLGDPEAYHTHRLRPQSGDKVERPGDCHPGFDTRVFAPSELATLESCESRRTMRWVLWAAKEAAYKAARQQRAEVIFSPVRFVVELNPTLRGFVSYGDWRWPVRVQQRENCIHALVESDDDGNTLWGSRHLTAKELEDPSRSVREFAITTIARRLSVSASDLRIERSGRIPRLFLASGGPPQALSLSHHGVYAGFACRIEIAQDELH